MIDTLEDLVGVTWVAKGRDPARGLDCLGLVLVAARRRGLPAREPADVAERVLNHHGWSIAVEDFPPDWVPVDPPWQQDDVLVLPDGRAETHLGFVSEPGWVLHCCRGVGVIRTQVSRLRVLRGMRWVAHPGLP